MRMPRELHNVTRELITLRVDDLAPDNFTYAEDAATWSRTRTQLQAVLSAGTVDALRNAPDACRELGHCIDADEYHTDTGAYNARGYAVVDDLCRAGFFEIHDPATMCSRRPRTRVVGGVRYCIG